jgi:hypothetical protein
LITYGGLLVGSGYSQTVCQTSKSYSFQCFDNL